ncbi:MAG: hypothetical protein IT292_06330 [Deltaproteobacteria bacterium]|nr:hypothetical protein [Deltaproteobacteria bacterium]
MDFFYSGGLIDDVGNDLPRSMAEMPQLNASVQEVLDWLPQGAETLILVLADHEAGGLSVTSDTISGGYPSVAWATNYHTAANVKAYAYGYGAENFSGTLDNTDISALIKTAGLLYNEPPVVNAGNDVQGNAIFDDGYVLPQQKQLQGSFSDDDVYAASGFSYSWQQASGLSAATIANEQALNTAATFSTAGRYVLRLTVNDGFTQSSDLMNVDLIEPPRVALSRVIDRTNAVHQLRIKFLEAIPAQPRYDTRNCQVRVYLLEGPPVVPTSKKLLAAFAAPLIMATVDLPFLPTSIKDPAAEMKYIYAQAHLVCPNNIKVR